MADNKAFAYKTAEKTEAVTPETAAQTQVPVSENTSLAKKIAAVVIALSILVIGPVKLSSLRSKAAYVFKNGTETGYTVSVYNDIRNSANAASTLAGICGSDELRSLAEKLLKEDDPSAMLEMFYELKLKADEVYTAYEKTAPSDLTSARNAYTTINSAYTTIGNDSYWQYADTYNSARSGFPASLMALYSGLSKLPDKTN